MRHSVPLMALAATPTFVSGWDCPRRLASARPERLGLPPRVPRRPAFGRKPWPAVASRQAGSAGWAQGEGGGTRAATAHGPITGTHSIQKHYKINHFFRSTVKFKRYIDEFIRPLRRHKIIRYRGALGPRGILRGRPAPHTALSPQVYSQGIAKASPPPGAKYSRARQAAPGPGRQVTR